MKKLLGILLSSTLLLTGCTSSLGSVSLEEGSVRESSDDSPVELGTGESQGTEGFVDPNAVDPDSEPLAAEEATDGKTAQLRPGASTSEDSPLIAALKAWAWPVENSKCDAGPFQIGYSRGGFAVLSCGPDGAWHPQDGELPVSLDPETGYPIEVVNEIRAQLANDPNSDNYDGRTQPSYEFTSVNYPNLDPCRLLDQETVRDHMAIGFPMPAERATLAGTLVVQVVAVDFEGDRSESDPKTDLKDRWQEVESFWETMSGGKADIVFRFPAGYLDLPGTFDSYGISTPFNQFGTYGQNFFDYAHEAIRLADPEIDFSDVDVVLVTAPTDIRNQVGTYVAEASMPNRPTKVVTKEKTIYNLLIRGADQPANVDNWIHEFGHMLGLTDFGHDGPRDDAANSEKGFYDIMTAYRNRELYAWNRFLLGVADERQLDCKTDQASSTHWLKPIEDGLQTKKAVMIPLSNHEVLIVESRRKQGLDSGLASTAEGAVVYRVDTRIGPPANALKIVSPGSRNPGDIRNQQSLKLGESVSYGGWTIEVMDSGKFGDVVQISKN